MTAGASFTFHARTDVGRQREQNEDSCGDVEAAGGELLIVCDGMGGHEAGEVASRIAVDTIEQIFQNSTEDDPGERLRRGFLVANQRILTHADQQGLDRMGTTAVATFVRDGEAWIAHVGDSRVYHLRGGAVLWRTSDHTRVQKMVERGILTAAEAKTHEDANIVTRALGFAKGEEAPEPDVAPRPLRDGDTLLLCSDGLHDLVTDDEIAELASYAAPDEVTRTLIELANRRGGHDNVTVAVLRWGKGDVARPAGARRTALEFGAEVPPPFDRPGTAKGTAAASADDRPRRAAVLVLAGVALVGLAAAVYLLTRGGGGHAGGGGGVARDGGASAIVNDAGENDAGVAVPMAKDAGAAAPVANDAATDFALPTWNPDAGRPKPKLDGGSAAGGPMDAGVHGPADAGTSARGAMDAGTAAHVPMDAGTAAHAPMDAGTTAHAALDAGTARHAALDAGIAARPPLDAGTARKPLDAGTGTGTGSAHR